MADKQSSTTWEGGQMSAEDCPGCKSKKYWEKIQQAADEVATWPSWKRGQDYTREHEQMSADDVKCPDCGGECGWHTKTCRLNGLTPEATLSWQERLTAARARITELETEIQVVLLDSREKAAEIAELKEMVFDLFAQGCKRGDKYDHMFISAYEYAQRYLLSCGLISELECATVDRKSNEK